MPEWWQQTPVAQEGEFKVTAPVNQTCKLYIRNT
jgi:hypothetical protein